MGGWGAVWRGYKELACAQSWGKFRRGEGDGGGRKGVRRLGAPWMGDERLACAQLKCEVARSGIAESSGDADRCYMETRFSLPLACCASCWHPLPISALMCTTFMSLGTDRHDSPNQVPPV